MQVLVGVLFFLTGSLMFYMGKPTSSREVIINKPGEEFTTTTIETTLHVSAMPILFVLFGLFLLLIKYIKYVRSDEFKRG